MINDMGIQVYDEAPDAETLLMSEAAPTAARRSRRGSSGSRRVDAGLRIRPHHRPGAHVHARNGLGRAADARRRNRNRQAHRGRPEVHDHGHLGLPDDRGADPRSGRKIERRTSCKIDDVVDGLDGLHRTTADDDVDEDDVDEVDEEEDEDDSGAIAAENTRTAEGRRRWSASRSSASCSRSMRQVLQKEGHKAPKYLELRKKIPPN